MVYVSVIGQCICCERVFSFNPNFVPSVRTVTSGPREPVCQDCMKRANAKRTSSGLKPLLIHPRAYEPEEEQ